MNRIAMTGLVVETCQGNEPDLLPMKTYVLDSAGQCIMRHGKPFLIASPCHGVSHDDMADALELAVAALNLDKRHESALARGFSVTSTADCRKKPANGWQCSWLGPNQRQCRKPAEVLSIVFSDPSMSHASNWYNVPLCYVHR